MDQTLISGLKQLGCNDKHIKLYRTSLQLGATTLPNLCKAARLQRSTAYLLVAELVEQGLMVEDHKTYRRLYAPAEPEAILRKLEAKHRQIGRTNLAFKELLPELQAAHQATTLRPRVRTYESKTGLLAILQDILRTPQEVLLWTNQASEQNIFEKSIHEQFIAERLRKQMPIRVLAVDNEQGRALITSDTSALRQTRLLPNTMNFTNETYIYGNTVAILDSKRDIFGMITENEQITDFHRTVFESMWNSCE